MKKIWQKIPYKPLLAILILADLFFYLVSYHSDSNHFFSETSLHLASICIELIIATFFVEKIVEIYKMKERKKKWRDAEEVANDDLKDLSLSLAYTLLLSFNIYTPVRPTQTTEEEEIQDVLDQITIFKNSNSKDLILKIAPFARERLRENLGMLKPEFETTLLLYKEILPADRLKQLWLTRVKFNKFYNSYIRNIDFVFDGTNKNPQTEEEKKHQDMIKSGFLTIISQDLTNYILQVENLIKKITS